MENNWTDKYLLNIDLIDQQHKVFFELMDKEIKQVDIQDYEQLASVIEKLEDYCIYHFKSEEEIMRKSGYKDIEVQIAQHKFFIQKIDILKQELNYSNPLLFEKITGFMKRWFLSHIIQSDKKFQDTVTEYLNDKEDLCNNI